jgi:hypothetical protein
MMLRLLIGFLCVWTCLVTSGCWWLSRIFGPPTRLSAWSIERVGVVQFTDLTNHGAGKHVADVFRRELAAAWGEDRVRPVSGPDNAVGLIGIGQAQQLGKSNGVEALLTGQVLAFGRQPRSGRVWVSVSLRLLEAGRGSIIWSRNATGTTSVADDASPTAFDAALDVATVLATKEFIHDLLAPPTQARAGVSAGADQPGHAGGPGLRVAVGGYRR